MEPERGSPAEFGARVHYPRPKRSQVLETQPVRVEDLSRAVVAHALELGFVRAAIAPAEELALADARWRAWLAAGFHGHMQYLADGERASPQSLLREAKSVICVALPYAAPSATPVQLPEAVGELAAYAQGGDYHPVLWNKLLALADLVAEAAGRPVLARPCVDTAPLLERALAARSGLGFVGKHGLVIAPGHGSYILLGELLVDLELAPGQPERDRCGSCRACLDVCPTGAFVGPFQLDARRCIAYLTIELKGPIPRELRPLIGTRVFGCDACQTTCPFNAGNNPRPVAPELAPRRQGLELVQLLELGSARYRSLVRESAVRRVSRDQLARNAAVALGNLGDPLHAPALLRALTGHRSDVVREHAAWALGRLRYPVGESEAVAEVLLRVAGEPGATALRAEASRSGTELLDRSQAST